MTEPDVDDFSLAIREVDDDLASTLILIAQVGIARHDDTFHGGVVRLQAVCQDPFGA